MSNKKGLMVGEDIFCPECNSISTDTDGYEELNTHWDDDSQTTYATGFLRYFCTDCDHEWVDKYETRLTDEQCNDLFGPPSGDYWMTDDKLVGL